MKYDVDLNNECIVTNIYDLPDNSPVGHIFSFHFANGEVVHTVCATQEWPYPCTKCLFDNKDECPWAPDAGEFVCEVYNCVFKELDKVLENL